MKLLAIDKNSQMYNEFVVAWKKKNISIDRFFSLCEAIRKLKREADSYIFIVINADNINYMNYLPILRDLTEIPILVFTSNYEITEYIEALLKGVDSYIL